MKCVYGLINLLNGKFYIGSTNNYSRRRNEHIWMLSNNRHPNKHLQNAINRYNINNFRFFIIEKIEDNRLIYDVEQLYLDKYKTYDKKIGYNLCKYSNSIDNSKIKKKVYQYTLKGDFVKSYESLAEAAKELNCYYGTISLAISGKNKTAKGFIWSNKEESINSIKEKINNSKYNFTLETYIKTQKTKIKRKQYKSILQYDLNNNFIKEYDTVSQASKSTGIGKDAIYGYCNKRYKKGKSGFIWKYK